MCPCCGETDSSILIRRAYCKQTDVSVCGETDSSILIHRVYCKQVRHSQHCHDCPLVVVKLISLPGKRPGLFITPLIAITVHFVKHVPTLPARAATLFATLPRLYQQHVSKPTHTTMLAMLRLTWLRSGSIPLDSFGA